MAEIHLCDLCDSVLTNNSYALAIAHESDIKTPISELDNFEDTFFPRPYNYKPKCQTLEICDGCYNVLQYFLKLRKQEILKLHKKIKKIDKNIDSEGAENVRG